MTQNPLLHPRVPDWDCHIKAGNTQAADIVVRELGRGGTPRSPEVIINQGRTGWIVRRTLRQTRWDQFLPVWDWDVLHTN